MIQIRNVSFNKSDFLYSIEYLNGDKVYKECTNEEALASLEIAKKVLSEKIRSFFMIDRMYEIDINSIRYPKSNDLKCSISLNFSTAIRRFTLNTRIFGLKEDILSEDQDGVVLAMNDLRDELERYVNGERAQMEFDFSGIEEE